VTLPQKRLLTAAFVAPMDGPLMRDAGVVIAGGTILAVGPAAALRAGYPDATVEDCGAVVLLPGLINAHAHLELTSIACGQPPAGFVPWVQNLMGATGATPMDQVPAAVAAAARAGVAQCLQYGVTTIGDISKQCAFTRPVLVEGPLRVVSFGEVQAMAQRRSLLDERFATATDLSCDSERLRIGVSPHAPYSIEPDGYRQCLEWSKRTGRPIATHLAETSDEATFLADHTGPFRELWRSLGRWDDAVPRFRGGPIRYAESMGLLDHPTLLAHVNYCDDTELTLLARGRASVVYCPRTHAFFGHPPHRWREMLASGINVAIGTDSCASSPNLNLVDDLRLVRRAHPEVPAAQLWELVTVRAAKALQMDREIGQLTVGRFADLVSFAAHTDEPLGNILDRVDLPNGVWIGGTRIC
jgi:cytosine/adenosine deaminase-related metal-dependent hydrolase